MAAGSNPLSHVVQHPIVTTEVDLGPLTPNGEITLLSDHITMIIAAGLLLTLFLPPLFRRRKTDDDSLEGMVPKVTTGYKPTCDCAPDEMPDPLERYLGPPELEPVPCVVLDPFAGSGTTLKVARDLGRSAIGIDISEEYKKLAVERARLNTKDILSYNEKG